MNKALPEKIQFFVQEKQSQRADHSSSVTRPSEYPSFVLVFNSDWNDYGYYTWFALWYFNSNGERVFIGEVRLMCKDKTNTYTFIPKKFDEPLPADYCSLGISSGYYDRLRSEFGKVGAYDVLRYLRDCAVDVSISDEFETDAIYKCSLLRDYSSERALKDARLILEERGPEIAYSFSFNFDVRYPHDKDSYIDISTDWDVDIKYFPQDFERIIGIIGENGVGKTTMLKAFTKNLISNESMGFNHKPLFKSLTIISSTKSDKYPPKDPEKRSIVFNTHVLESSEENEQMIFQAAKNIENSAKLVNGDSKISFYRNIVCEIIGADAKSLFKEEIIDRGSYEENKITIREDTFKERLHILSSGQLHMLAMITYLISDMHVGALVIIDEPEVHLHPSSIVYFMLNLYDVLRQFDGYCFIATHSPLIIREILRNNVYEFVRTHENIPIISKVRYDTFGEDISILYDRVFGYNEQLSIFNKTVESLAKGRKDRKEIESIIGEKSQMNLNARLRIFDILNAHTVNSKTVTGDSDNDA